MSQNPCLYNKCHVERLFGNKSSQKILIEQLHKEKIHGRNLEDKVEIAENKITELENILKTALHENKFLKEISNEDKRKIAELIEECIESTRVVFDAFQQKNAIFLKMNDLMKINEELSREIKFDMTKQMRELNNQDKRMLRPPIFERQ